MGGGQSWRRGRGKASHNARAGDWLAELAARPRGCETGQHFKFSSWGFFGEWLNGREGGRDDEMANDATLPMTYASGSAPNLSSFSYGHFKIWSRDTPDRDFPQSTKHDGTLHPPIHLHSSYTCWNRSWPSKLSCKFLPPYPRRKRTESPFYLMGSLS